VKGKFQKKGKGGEKAPETCIETEKKSVLAQKKRGEMREEGGREGLQLEGKGGERLPPARKVKEHIIKIRFGKKRITSLRGGLPQKVSPNPLPHSTEKKERKRCFLDWGEGKRKLLNNQRNAGVKKKRGGGKQTKALASGERERGNRMRARATRKRGFFRANEKKKGKKILPDKAKKGVERFAGGERFQMGDPGEGGGTS